MERIRVLLVDDHTLFRQGLVALLKRHRSIKVVGDAVDGLDALDKARQLAPDVVLMDARLPRCSGAESTRLITTELPTVKVVMLTMSEEDEDVFAAIKSGAAGYLLKTVDENELIASILHVGRGGAVISPTVAARLLAEFRQATPAVAEAPKQTALDLTERERQILQLVAEGATNKEIARSLLIAETTVKTHIRNILEKLHLTHRSQAAAYAVRAGLVDQR